MKGLKRLFLAFISVIALPVWSQPVIYTRIAGTPPPTDFLIDNNGNDVWMATTPGISHVTINNGTATVQRYLDTGAFPQPFFCIDKRGNTVVAGGYGEVAKFNGTSWSVYSWINTALPLTIQYDEVAIEASGKIWLRDYRDSVYTLDGTTVQRIGQGKAIAVHPTQNIAYVASAIPQDGIVRIRNGVRDTLPLISSIITKNMIRKLEFVDGYLFAESVNGLFAWDGNQWITHFNSVVQQSAPLSNGRFAFIEQSDVWFESNGNNTDTLGIPSHTSARSINQLESHNDYLYYFDGFSLVKVFPELLNKRSQGTISNGRLELGFSSVGSLFRKFDSHDLNSSFFRLDNRNVVFAGNLWMSGTKNGSPMVGAEEYRMNSLVMSSGPYSTQVDSAFLAKYDRVWVVTKAQVERHKLNYGSSLYVMPEGIATWPGNGDESKGEGRILAPFVDRNFNGIYEPKKGDYPQIRGDECAYFIYNDSRGPVQFASSSGAGMEVHGMAFVYDTTDPAINKTLFLSYRVINRDVTPIDNMKLGMWVDYDLGFPNDDLLQSDSVLQISYAQNADNNDEGPLGFGAYPPAVGVMGLSEDFTGHMYYVNSTSTINGNIGIFTDIQNYMRQQFKNGSPLRAEVGGDGYDQSGTLPRTHWAFNDQLGWSSGAMDDNRSILTTSEQTLNAGEEWCLDLAFVVGQDSSAMAFQNSVLDMKNNMGVTETFYQSKSFPCLSEGVSLEEEHAIRFDLYPNPVGPEGKVHLTSPEFIAKYEVYNLLGQKVDELQLSSPQNELEINLSGYAPGGYLIRATSREGGIHTEVVIVQ